MKIPRVKQKDESEPEDPGLCSAPAPTGLIISAFFTEINFYWKSGAFPEFDLFSIGGGGVLLYEPWRKQWNEAIQSPDLTARTQTHDSEPPETESAIEEMVFCACRRLISSAPGSGTSRTGSAFMISEMPRTLSPENEKNVSFTGFGEGLNMKKKCD